MLHYNENKIVGGEARLLLANGFAAEIDGFTLEQKLKRFEQLTMLNTRVKTNAVHISLNFDPQDKLNAKTLQQISMAYMERIGFGDQPYLVYQHIDAAHTHVHIATVNVRADGSRIDTHGIGWKLSEPARQAIEKECGLIEAKGRMLSNQLALKPVNIVKARYGHSLTKRAITNVVNAIIRDYRFTSLAEFNAVLRQFNVTVDRGGENSLMHEKGGLLYSLTGKNGEQIGIPIKASAIYNKPTLKNLQKEFERNKERRQLYREPLKQAIELPFKKYQSLTKNTFIAELLKRNIVVLFRSNAQGFTYGVTFIDHQNRMVFNGSDLGKGYGAKDLLERFSVMDKPLFNQKATQQATTAQQLSAGQLPRIALANYQAQAAPSITRKKKKRKHQDQELGL